ncbi:hypothetical protein HS125_09125 [bacterium]|nr:hypothetical protein [bacterium]
MARAPVRVDLAGGGSDVPFFCAEHDGAVLSVCIARYVYARLRFHAGPKIIVQSEDLNEQVSADRLEGLPLTGRLALLCGIARRLGPEDASFHFSVYSDVPEGSGLGASGALGVAGVGVFDAALGGGRSREQVAALGNEIERVDLGLAGGSQDSYGPAFGGVNFIEYPAGRLVRVEPLPLPESLLRELERRCVLVHTGQGHVSGSIHDDIAADYRRPHSPTKRAMLELAAIARESREALLSGELERWGELLSENWRHHQRLHASCSSRRLQAFYQAAAPHVVGGKTCGAGGGGCIVFLAREGRRRALERALDALGGLRLPFVIDQVGLSTWTLPTKE